MLLEYILHLYFFYNSFYDAAAHTIAAGTTKDARDRTFWLRSFAFSGKIKQGIARVSNFALLGMDATRGPRELYRTFLKLDDDDYFRVLHVEPARKAGKDYRLDEKFETLTSGRLYVVVQAVNLFTLYRAPRLS